MVGEAGPGCLVLTDSNTLAIEVDALSIPRGLEVSVEGAEIGTQILAGQVTLPAGATLVTDPEALVVAVSAPTVEAEPERARKQPKEPNPLPSRTPSPEPPVGDGGAARRRRLFRRSGSTGIDPPARNFVPHWLFSGHTGTRFSVVTRVG